ncbi:MAG: substrate-binding domain-containing protein [Lentisphaeria bacterium]|nr:substrate-binding domain-containing protein [Lentisphaeria bacterium]
MDRRDNIYSRKVRKAADCLRQMILPLPGGTVLPGIRSLMKRTSAGQVTVTNALRELQEEGLIRIKPSSGIFRIRPPENNREIRLIHWQVVDPERRTGFFQILFRKLKEYADASGWRISVEYVENRLPEEIAAELANDGISRCIICSSLVPDFAARLKKHMAVCLELLPRHTWQVTATLRDAPDMTVRQMKYLFQRGYRRIGYLSQSMNDTSRYPIQVLRIKDYYRLMAENGLRVDPDWVFQYSESFDDLGEGLTRIMSAKPPPEALIAPSPSVLRRLYPWCRKHHIRIGKDLAIFCCDEGQERFDPEVTTITNNPESIAKTFWEMFQAAERGENVESRYTELFIRTGLTVPSRTPPSPREQENLP